MVEMVPLEILLKSGSKKEDITIDTTILNLYLFIKNPFKSGEPERIRTPDLLLRRQLLYPAELLAHN